MKIEGIQKQERTNEAEIKGRYIDERKIRNTQDIADKSDEGANERNKKAGIEIRM